MFVSEGADYRYRAILDRHNVADQIAAAIRGIDYDSHFGDVAIAGDDHPSG